MREKVGLLVIDFECGDLLKLSGTATIDHTLSKIEKYPGAQRLLNVSINQVVRTRGGSALRWKSMEYSPFNPALT